MNQPTEKPTFSIQLVRDVVVIGPDGTGVRTTETMTAQVKWDTPDGQPPAEGGSYNICGDWRIVS